MTASEMNQQLGRHVYLEPIKGLQFRCRVTDVKQTYGRPRLQIEAIEGQGKAWVAAESVSPCYPDHREGGSPNALRS